MGDNTCPTLGRGEVHTKQGQPSTPCVPPTPTYPVPCLRSNRGWVPEETQRQTIVLSQKQGFAKGGRNTLHKSGEFM